MIILPVRKLDYGNQTFCHNDQRPESERRQFNLVHCSIKMDFYIHLLPVLRPPKSVLLVWFYYPHMYVLHVSPCMKYAQPILQISHEQYKLKIPSVYYLPLSHNFLSLRSKYSPYYTHTVTVPLNRSLCEKIQKILTIRIITAEYERN